MHLPIFHLLMHPLDSRTFYFSCSHGTYEIGFYCMILVKFLTLESWTFGSQRCRRMCMMKIPLPHLPSSRRGVDLQSRAFGLAISGCIRDDLARERKRTLDWPVVGVILLYPGPVSAQSFDSVWNVIHLQSSIIWASPCTPAHGQLSPINLASHSHHRIALHFYCFFVISLAIDLRPFSSYTSNGFVIFCWSYNRNR